MRKRSLIARSLIFALLASALFAPSAGAMQVACESLEAAMQLVNAHLNLYGIAFQEFYTTNGTDPSTWGPALTAAHADLMIGWEAQVDLLDRLEQESFGSGCI